MKHISFTELKLQIKALGQTLQFINKITNYFE